MKVLKPILLLSLRLLAIPGSSEAQDDFSWTDFDPPFDGTIFISAEIITESDKTTFVNLSDAGQAPRTMFDRRVDDWLSLNPYLFKASYEDDLSIEIQVNPEFQDIAIAREVASKYAVVIGRLPQALRKKVETVWIHQGTEPFGGGNNNLLIHTGQSTFYENEGILEETLVHEASHTSLDDDHSQAPGWLLAQEADGAYISTYAQDYPEREDIAESFLLYLALRYRADRISESLKDTILETMPNRLIYFDDQHFPMYPLE